VTVRGDVSIDGSTKEAVLGVIEAGAGTVEALASATRESIKAATADPQGAAAVERAQGEWRAQLETLKALVS
jgi:hypothetical protein